MHFPVALNPQVQVLYGQGIGLGLAAPINGLGIAPVFKCTASQCYSIDGRGTSAGTHLLFVNLQKAINRYAAEAGFKRIATDGFLGESTRSAAAKALGGGIRLINRRITAMSGWEAATYGPRLSTARAMLTAATMFTVNLPSLAGGAQHLFDALKYAADALGLESTSSSTPTPIVSPDNVDDHDHDHGMSPTTLPLPPAYDPYTTSASPGLFQKKHAVWYAAGAILLAGLGIATYLVWKG